jgi:putative addiction module CopG family antidote
MTHHISIPPYFEKVIQDYLDSGKYNTEDEVIQEALNLLDKEAKQSVYLDKLLAEGENSGELIPFNNTEFKKNMQTKYQ